MLTSCHHDRCPALQRGGTHSAQTTSSTPAAKGTRPLPPWSHALQLQHGRSAHADICMDLLSGLLTLHFSAHLALSKSEAMTARQ